MSLKNILIACSSPPDRDGGICSYSKELTEALVRQGKAVFYASPKPNDFSWINAHASGFLGTSPRDDQAERCRSLLKFISDNKIEAAINNDNAVLQSVAPWLNIPLIVIGHMDQFSIATVACHESDWADYVVAISYDMRKTFIARGVAAYKCPVIYNGVRDPGPNVRDPLTRRALRVVFVGDTKRKGMDLVASSLRMNATAWDGIELSWFGNIPAKLGSSLKQATPSLRLEGKVPRSEFEEALKSADILLLPSRAEGCPMALLEAISRGVVPVVSDGVGAMRWMVDSGVDGFVCSLNNWPAESLDCLKFLKNNPDFLAEMSLKARERFIRQFDISFTAEKLVSLLSRPTVQRMNKPEVIQVLRWHRTPAGSGKASLWERFCFRFGVKRIAGSLSQRDSSV
jgi:glycosyltransferase involved in cell wall biosynthesis